MSAHNPHSIYGGKCVEEWRVPGGKWRCENCGTVGKWGPTWGYHANMEGYQCKGVFCSDKCAIEKGVRPKS